MVKKNRFLLSTLMGLGLMSQCFTSPKYWGYNFQQISEGFNMSQMRTMVLEYLPTKFWAIWGVNVGKYSSTMEHFNVFLLSTSNLPGMVFMNVFVIFRNIRRIFLDSKPTKTNYFGDPGMENLTWQI